MRWSPLSTRIELRRRLLRGSAGSHWPQSLPILGTPVDVPQPRIRTFNPLPLGLTEQLEEIRRRRFGELVELLAAQPGDEGGGIGDEGWLAFLAAVRDGRKERRIGLDQHPVGR